MRQIILLLFLLLLCLGGCAITIRSWQPTVDAATQALIAAETRTDPIDDLVRFRESERLSRSATRLLPLFVLLTAALLLLAVTTPLPHLLKELRLLRKSGRPSRGHPSPSARSSPWIESPTALPPATYPEQATPGLPQLPPPVSTGWLEEE